MRLRAARSAFQIFKEMRHLGITLLKKNDESLCENHLVVSEFVAENFCGRLTSKPVYPPTMFYAARDDVILTSSHCSSGKIWRRIKKLKLNIKKCLLKIHKDLKVVQRHPVRK